MRSAVRATAVLTSGSLLSVLVGVAAMKAYAVMLGPSGVGLMGLLLGLLGLATVLTGAGLAAGLVKLGASESGAGDATGLGDLYRGSWLLFWVLGSGAVLLLLVFRAPIGRLMVGEDAHGASVILIGVALLFAMATEIEVGALNACRRVRALATAGVLRSALGAAAGLGLVLAGGESAVPAAILASAVAGWTASRLVLRRSLGRLPASGKPGSARRAAAKLFRFSGPYSLGLAVSRGVQLALPALVLHEVGRESVGFYRGAVVIATNYLGFLLLAMSQDYFPRLSAAAGDGPRLAWIVNDQQRLVMLLSVPVILLTMALAPHVVPLIYTAEFVPTAGLLEWLLVADLLRFSSWTMGFVVLAAASSRTYFATQLAAGALIFGCTWSGLRWLGLPGLGVGFLVAYAGYFLLVSAVARRRAGIVWTVANRRLLIASLLAGSVVLVLPLTPFEPWRTPVALSFALMAAGHSAREIHKALGSPRGEPEEADAAAEAGPRAEAEHQPVEV